MTGIRIKAIKHPNAVPNANAQFKLTAPPIKSLTVLPRPAPIIAPKPLENVQVDIFLVLVQKMLL